MTTAAVYADHFWASFLVFFLHRLFKCKTIFELLLGGGLINPNDSVCNMFVHV